MRPSGRAKAVGRGVALVAAMLGVAACSSIQNMSPDWSQFRLPDTKTFVPTTVTAYSRPVTASESVGPLDLADGQGLCPNMAPAASSSTDAPSAIPPDQAANRNVGLEMTECEVVRIMGQPQGIEIGNSADRATTMTFTTGERAGIYRFARGRLVSIERGSQPPPEPVVAKKPPPKKPKKPPTPPV